MHQLLISLFVLWSCVLSASYDGFPESVKVLPVLVRDEASIPKISMVNDTLIVSENVTRQMTLFYLGEPMDPVTVEGSFGNMRMATDPSGWVAACMEGGMKITLFHIGNPERAHYLNFSPNYSLSCLGLDIEVTPSGSPLLWIGSVQDRTVALIDPFYNPNSWAVIGNIQPVSGVSNIQSVGKYLFTINSILLAPQSSVPFIMDKMGKPFAGNPLGEAYGTSLRREYTSDIFPDEKTRRVYYINPHRKELHGFLMDRPNEQMIKKIPFNVTMASDVSRYGKCLVVMGHKPSYDNELPNLKRIPQWSVLETLPNGQVREILTTDYLPEEGLQHSIYQEIDSKGTIYVAHQMGVSAVYGLLKDLNCK